MATQNKSRKKERITKKAKAPHRQKPSKVVAVAEKSIDSFKRAGKWVKGHKRIVYLTAQALLAMAAAYWYHKKKILKAQQKLNEQVSQTIHQQSRVTGKLGEQVVRNTQNLSEVAKQQQTDKMAQQIGLKRIEALEQMIAKKDFREWLAKRHGLKNLQSVEEYFKKHGGKKK